MIASVDVSYTDQQLSDSATVTTSGRGAGSKTLIIPTVVVAALSSVFFAYISHFPRSSAPCSFLALAPGCAVFFLPCHRHCQKDPVVALCLPRPSQQPTRRGRPLWAAAAVVVGSVAAPDVVSVAALDVVSWTHAWKARTCSCYPSGIVVAAQDPFDGTLRERPPTLQTSDVVKPGHKWAWALNAIGCSLHSLSARACVP